VPCSQAAIIDERKGISGGKLLCSALKAFPISMGAT